MPNRNQRRRPVRPGSPPEVFVTVPLWIATWGTTTALVAAPNRQQAQAIAVQRNAQSAPGRFPHRVYLRPATHDDVETFAESDALPAWCAHLADAPSSPDASQEPLSL